MDEKKSPELEIKKETAKRVRKIMDRYNEWAEAITKLDTTFKELEEKYSLEYFCLAIYPKFRGRLSHEERC